MVWLAGRPPSSSRRMSRRRQVPLAKALAHAWFRARNEWVSDGPYCRVIGDVQSSLSAPWGYERVAPDHVQHLEGYLGAGLGKEWSRHLVNNPLIRSARLKQGYSSNYFAGEAAFEITPRDVSVCRTNNWTRKWTPTAYPLLVPDSPGIGLDSSESCAILSL